MDEKNNYISLSEASRYCQYSQEYLSLRARQGKLKSIKIGRNWMTTIQWLKEYVAHAQEFQNGLNKRRTTAKISRKHFPSFARAGVAIALSIAFIFSGVAFGKDGFSDFANNFIVGAQEFSREFEEHVQKTVDDFALGVQSLEKNFANGSLSLAALGDFAGDYFQWLRDNLSFLGRDIARGYVVLNEKIDQGIKDDIRTLDEAFRKTTSAMQNALTSLPDMTNSMVKDIAEVVGKEYQKLAKVIGSFATNPWKQKDVSSRFDLRSLPTIESEPSQPQLSVAQQKDVRLSEDKESVLSQPKEIVREVIREVEVSRVTRIEPVKEITREVITVDGEALNTMRSSMREVLAWRGDIENLKQITQKLQAAPANTLNSVAPVYIGSPGLQVGGNANFGSLGVSGSAGIKDLGVSESASIGSEASDRLSVSATSTFSSPVTIRSSLTVGTSTLSIDTAGNLTTTGTITAASIKTLGSNGALSLEPAGAGTGQTGELRLFELAANGLNYVGLKAPDSIANNVIWTLPGADGLSGQMLSTNGLGVLSWTTVSSSTAAGWTDAGTAIRLETLTDSVGIGIATPSSKLHIVPSAAAALQIDPFGVAAGNTGEFRLLELVANGTNYIGFKAPDSIGADRTWTLPGADGTDGQALITNGLGVLSWGQAGVNDASYVVLGVHGTLTGERVLTGTANQITISDNGSGGTVVLSTPQSIHTGATPTFAGLTLNGNLDMTNDLVLNIGDAGTDFTTGGGLTIGGTAVLTVNPLISPAVSTNGSITDISGTLAEAGLGIHARLVGLNITAPTITAGAASVTNTASLYISAAPSASGATNYALWADAGDARFDGNVGVGITSGVPSATLHVVGQCVTGDTLLKRKRRRKRVDGTDEEYWEKVRIDHIKPGDEIQTLDETSGQFVAQKVEKLMDMGVKEIYTLTTAAGKTIRTTGNHPYLVVPTARDAKIAVFIDGANMEASLQYMRARIDYEKLLAAFGGSRNTVYAGFYQVSFHHAPQERFFGKLKHLGYRIISKPLKVIQQRGKEDEHKGNFDVEIACDSCLTNESFDVVVLFSGDSDFAYLVKKLQERGKRVIVVAPYRATGRELHQQADMFLSIAQMPFVDFANDNNKKGPQRGHHTQLSLALPILEQVKPFVKGGVWTKVSELREGQMIATVGTNGKPVSERIVSIKRTHAEQVYDIQVANTHNFIGNDIVAHNTYINTSTDSGIGLDIDANSLTTGTGLDISSISTAGTGSGSSKLLNLSRSGANANASHSAYGVYASITNTGTTSTNIAGYFSASGATNNYGGIFENGNVGIGDTTPDVLLDILSATTGSDIIITNTNATDTDVRLGLALVDGTNNFTLGVDDSDNDTFKIGTSALETSTLLTLDSRTTISGVSAVTLAGITPTIASATTAEYTTLTLTPPTITLTGGTQVTSQMDSILINGPTITDSSTITVDKAATLTVSGSPTAAGSVTITAPVALSVLNGTFRQDIVSSFTAKRLAGGLNHGIGYNGIFVSGKYAYLGVASGSFGADDFSIVNISDPSNPVVEGTVDFCSTCEVSSIFVAGRYAYASSVGGNDLRIIDISNPGSPTEVGSLDLAALIRDIFVSGKYAYIATGGTDSGQDLQIIDISNPTSPTLKGGIDLANIALSVYVQGRYAYVGMTQAFGGNNRFRIIDVADPASPTEVGTGLALDEDVGALYASGIYVYSSQGTNTGTEFRIIDVSTPSSPSVVGGLEIGRGAGSISVAGRYAYVSIATGTGNDFLIIDISTPSSPSDVGGFDVAESPGSVVSGKYAYLTIPAIAGSTCPSQCEFQVLDLSGIDAPSATIGTIASNYLSVSDNARVDGSFYVGTGLDVGSGGLHVQGGSGIYGDVTITGIANTIASAATAEYTTLTVTPPTITLTGGTQVTSQMDSILISQPTITDTTAITVDDAATMTIAGAAISGSGGSVTISDSYALKINTASVDAGTGTVTRAYGLYVDAPTGAGTNYAAAFVTGNVGIGTTSPSRTLDVTGNWGGNAVTTSTTDSGTTSTISTKALSYYVESTDTTGSCATGSKTFDITGLSATEGSYAFIVSKATDGGCSSSTLTVTVTINGTTISTVANANAGGTVTENYVVVYANGAWRILGSAAADSADLAEWFPYTGEEPEPGELVMIADESVTVRRSERSYSPKLIGIVSTNPHTTMGPETPNSVRVALAGRVSTKVSTENGPIEIGDYLTSSSSQGVAMKATKAGNVVGQALESFDGRATECVGEKKEDTTGTSPEAPSPADQENQEEQTELDKECKTVEVEAGKILVFINPHWSIGSLNENGLLEGSENEVGASEESENMFLSFVNNLGSHIKEVLAGFTGTIKAAGEWVFDRISVKTARVEKLEIVDSKTGDIYCTWLEYGEWMKTKGECDSIQITPLSSDAQIPDSSGNSEQEGTNTPESIETEEQISEQDQPFPQTEAASGQTVEQEAVVIEEQIPEEQSQKSGEQNQELEEQGQEIVEEGLSEQQGQEQSDQVDGGSVDTEKISENIGEVPAHLEVESTSQP